MPIKSIKEKITSIASGEILGESEKDKQAEAKTVKPKEKKAPRPKKEKVVKPKVEKPAKPKREKPVKPKVEEKVSRNNFFKRKEEIVVEEKPKSMIPEAVESEEKEPSSVDNKAIREAIAGYEDVLSILGIKEDLKLTVDFNSKDMDYIKFTQTTPLGFDFDEVTDCLARLKYTLNKYEMALSQRDKEVIILASEVKKVEHRMVSQNQAKELERMIGGMTEEERLIEENMNLKIELNELKNKLITSGSSDVSTNREIEALRAENEMLKLNAVNANGNQLPSVEKESNVSGGLPRQLPSDIGLPAPDSLPSLETAPEATESVGEESSIDNMMKSIGGMYDD